MKIITQSLILLLSAASLINGMEKEEATVQKKPTLSEKNKLEVLILHCAANIWYNLTNLKIDYKILYNSEKRDISTLHITKKDPMEKKETLYIKPTLSNLPNIAINKIINFAYFNKPKSYPNLLLTNKKFYIENIIIREATKLFLNLNLNDTQNYYLVTCWEVKANEETVICIERIKPDSLKT